MKLSLRIRHPKTIVGKMTVRLLLIELLVLALLVLLSQMFLLPRLRKNAIREYSETMNSLSIQLDSQVNQYASYSQFIIRTDSIRELIAAYREDPGEQNYHLLALALTEQISSSKNIRGVQLESGDGTVFRSAVNLRDTDFAQLDAPWYRDILESESSRSFSSIYDPGLSTPGHSLAYVRTYYVGTEKYVLTLFFNCADLISIVDTTSFFSGVLITDHGNTPFYEQGDIADSYAVSGQVGSASNDYLERPEGYYFYATVPSSNWKLMGFVDTATLMQNYWSIFTTAMLLCVALCLLTVLVAIPTMSRTIRPIQDLSQTMQQVAAGDRTVSAREDGDDEIGELSRIFNQMLQNLNESVDRQIAFETNEQKMRYNLLLAQIDSHFIGNTMSLVNSLARQGRTDDVIALNTALLIIIQNHLRIRDLDITDTIAQEMEIVEQYWLITKIRQENHAVLTWDVPDEILEDSIPKNIIQPLVENSLFHGLTDELTGEISGEIHVSARDMGDRIRIEVRDNGKGIDTARLAYLNSPEETLDYLRERGRHIGIANIRQRLQYFYKTDCVRITCEKGTTVTLDIPKTTIEEETTRA